MFLSKGFSRFDFSFPGRWSGLDDVLRVWFRTLNSFLHGLDSRGEEDYRRTKYFLSWTDDEVEKAVSESVDEMICYREI